MVLAHADGVVTGLRPLKVGDRVARGEVLGEIIPLSTKRQMVQLGRAPTEPTAPTAPTAPMASEGALLSLQDGLVVETLVNNADVVKAGQALLSLEPVERQLEAVIYLPANGMAKALRPGMQVQLSPAHTRRESVGYLQGEISEIAKYPSTDTAMMSLFGNAQLVREFSAAGAPQAVTVVLKIDPDSASGYQWSTAAGARVALSSGTLVQARFVLDASSPIAVGLRRARL